MNNSINCNVFDVERRDGKCVGRQRLQIKIDVCVQRRGKNKNPTKPPLQTEHRQLTLKWTPHRPSNTRITTFKPTARQQGARNARRLTTRAPAAATITAACALAVAAAVCLHDPCWLCLVAVVVGATTTPLPRHCVAAGTASRTGLGTAPPASSA